MLIEEYHSIIYNFYEWIKNDYRLCIENGNVIKVELLSDCSKKIIKTIEEDVIIKKKNKIDKITRKFLRRIDSYKDIEKRISESTTISPQETEEGLIYTDTKNDKNYNLNYNRYESIDVRKILRNNLHLKRLESENEDPFSSNFSENTDTKIIDRLKDLKNNISFFKLHEFINFSKK